MIYLIESGNFYKIGFIENLKSRMKQYATHNPDCKFVDSFNGDREDEKELHELCKEFNHSSEWFNKDKRILEIFQEYKNSSINIYNKKIKDLKYKVEKLKDDYDFLNKINNKQISIVQEIIDIYKEINSKFDSVCSILEKSNADITDLKSRLAYLESQFQED